MMSTFSDERALSELRRIHWRGPKELAEEAGQVLRVWPLLRREEKAHLLGRVLALCGESAPLSVSSTVADRLNFVVDRPTRAYVSLN